MNVYSVLSSEYFVIWGVGIPVLYFLLSGVLRCGNWLPKTVRGSDGSDMMAYSIVACFCCFYVGVAGSMAWFNVCPGCDLEDITQDRMYGRSEFFERHLAAPLLTYQFWNFVFCVVVAEMRDATTLVHHVASGLCPYFSVHPFLQYYGVFFYGVPEVSSVPLTYITLSKCFPFLKTEYPNIYQLSKWSFGLLFVIIRLVMWTYVTVFYWIDSVDLVRNGTPHSMFVVGYYWFANVVLTGMQYFWGYKIIQQMCGGGREVRKVSDRKTK